MGVLDFLLNVLSVGNSIVVDVSVGVPDGGQFVDLFSIVFLLDVVLDVKLRSLIKSRLLEVVEDLHDSVHGVTSVCLHLEKSVHLGLIGECERNQADKEECCGFHCEILCGISLCL